mgnify:FL=1
MTFLDIKLPLHNRLIEPPFKTQRRWARLYAKKIGAFGFEYRGGNWPKWRFYLEEERA